MRDLIEKLLKNQKYLFISVFGGFGIIFLCWYFLLHKSLSKEYKRSSNAMTILSSDVNKIKMMESELNSMESEWAKINNEFEMVINKIPDKRLFENVTDFLYSLIINHGLKIKNFSPSQVAIDKKTIFLPETDDEVTIEKIPIDITLQGSFINFGQLLESMVVGKYRLTASNIEVIQKQSSSIQTIKLISYVYFQTQTKKPLAQRKTSRTLKKNNPTSNATNSVKTINNPKTSTKIKNAIKEADSLEGVPEMWLEPATEPIEGLDITNKSTQESKTEDSIPATPPSKDNTNNNIEITKTESEKEKETKKKEDLNLYNNIVVLDSKVCKKVKNNLPLYPGKRFPADIGKVYCHSLLNNNSGKYNDIYHIWYMNGNLKSKVRIRVRNGKEIPTISHREVKNTDKGTWKIEITDSDKKILDTVIFEVV